VYFFFFQAEDGIRDRNVTGVQTCALPIFVTYVGEPNERAASIYVSPQIEPLLGYAPDEWLADPELFAKRLHPDDRERVLAEHARSEERRVGKECRARGSTQAE